MKRFITILSVVALVVAMAVPAFAAEAEPVHKVGGTWYFNSTLTDYTELEDTVGHLSISFTLPDGTVRRGIRFVSYGVQYQDDFGFKTVYGSSWGSENSRTVSFGTYKEVPEAFYNWLTENATELFCDGSVCSVADVDLDGVCDTCRSVLRLVPFSYPSLPVVEGQNQQSVIVMQPSGMYYYLVLYSDTPFAAIGSRSASENANYVVSSSISVNYQVFTCSDGETWVKNAEGENITFGVGYNVTVVKSSFDWRDSAGNLFFPVPLWMELDRVTQGEMPATMEAIVRTMLTLLLCGVGCLAFLISLKLLPKVLYRFL